MTNFIFALADTATQPGIESLIMPIVMIVGMIAVFWWMSRKQKKEEKQYQEMKNSVCVGDEITTIGGIIGRVVNVKEETIVIETSKDRTKIQFLKSAIKSIDVRANVETEETK